MAIRIGKRTKKQRLRELLRKTNSRTTGKFTAGGIPKDPRDMPRPITLSGPKQEPQK